MTAHALVLLALLSSSASATVKPSPATNDEAGSSLASAAVSPSPASNTKEAGTHKRALLNAPPTHKFALDAVVDFEYDAAHKRADFESSADGGLTTLNGRLSDEWYLRHVQEGAYFAFFGTGRMPSLGVFSGGGDLIETIHHECEILRLTDDALFYLAERKNGTLVLTHRAISRALKTGYVSLDSTFDEGGTIAPTRTEWHAWLAENAYPIAGWGSEEAFEWGKTHVDRSGDEGHVDWIENTDDDEKGDVGVEETSTLVVHSQQVQPDASIETEAQQPQSLRGQPSDAGLGHPAGDGCFVSSFNGDSMEVRGREMRVFKRGAGNLIGHVSNAATPSFEGAFPWGHVYMVWDGEAWQESGSSDVFGFLANARWKPMVCPQPLLYEA